MVFEVVTSDDDITPLFIFSHCFKHNTKVFINCLEVVIQQNSMQHQIWTQDKDNDSIY